MCLYDLIDLTQINRLQAIQNAFARDVTTTPKHPPITSVLKKHHWLKIPERIEYKVIPLTYNTIQSFQPSILPTLILCVCVCVFVCVCVCVCVCVYVCVSQLFTIQPPRSTRSSSTLTLLRLSITSSLKFSNRSITIAVPPLLIKLHSALQQISESTYEPAQTSPLKISSGSFTPN